MLARGVDVGEEAVEDEPEAEVDACADRGWYEACEGDATRELEGVFAGVVELELYRSVGGTQLKGLPGWLLEPLVASCEACSGEGMGL